MTPEFVANVYHALKEVAMPGSEGELKMFFAGDPGMEAEESDGDERGEEGGAESEDEMSPPGSKRRKRIVRKRSKQERKSLGVRDLQVWMHTWMSDSI